MEEERMGRKCVFVNVEPSDDSGETYRTIRETGCELILGVEGAGRRYTDDQLIELCRNADAVTGGSREKFTRRVIESLPKLRVISKLGTGTDSIDVEAATERGILVTHTPVNTVAVAEHTVALILAGLKKVKEGDRKVREGGWRDADVTTTLMQNRTVGILGFGRIGGEIAKRLQGWEMKILAYDPYAKEEALARHGVQRCIDLFEMLERVDVLSINAVLTKETRHMIGEEALRRLKKTAYVVNTSRGEIIDEKALISALKEKRILGAALDVMEKEPPDPKNELLSLENVILTPHMSAMAPEVNWALRYTAMENALTALRGEIPKYVKNPEVLEVWLAKFGKKTELSSGG
jgi:phosphoglycerate dehydrogenase-like enzyme